MKRIPLLTWVALLSLYGCGGDETTNPGGGDDTLTVEEQEEVWFEIVGGTDFALSFESAGPVSVTDDCILGGELSITGSVIEEAGEISVGYDATTMVNSCSFFIDLDGDSLGDVDYTLVGTASVSKDPGIGALIRASGPIQWGTNDGRSGTCNLTDQLPSSTRGRCVKAGDGTGGSGGSGGNGGSGGAGGNEGTGGTTAPSCIEIGQSCLGMFGDCCDGASCIMDVSGTTFTCF